MFADATATALKHAAAAQGSLEERLRLHAPHAARLLGLDDMGAHRLATQGKAVVADFDAHGFTLTRQRSLVHTHCGQFNTVSGWGPLLAERRLLEGKVGVLQAPELLGVAPLAQDVAEAGDQGRIQL